MKNQTIRSFLFAAAFLFSLSVWAKPSPIMRLCYINGAQYLEVSVEEPRMTNYYGFCVFPGGGKIEGTTFAQHIDGTSMEAVNNFKSGEDLNCESSNAQVVEATILPPVSKPMKFCKYKDGSIMELETLKKGSSNPDNEALSKVL